MCFHFQENIKCTENQKQNCCLLEQPPIEFCRPIIQEEYHVVRQPPIEANNFELKPALTTMVQQCQFTSHPSEDPNEHLGRFMRMENTVKLNGVRLDVIKLQLFPFSLRDVQPHGLSHC